MSTNYDELAARAERGDLTVKPGTVRRGAEAAAEALQILLEASYDEPVTRLGQAGHKTNL